MFARRAVPEGIRITKVGVWYVLLTLLVGAAAANTGNNALYLVISLFLGLLVSSGIASRRNVRKLGLEADVPSEIYAKQTFSMRLGVNNLDRWFPRVLLLLSTDTESGSLFMPFLPRGGRGEGAITTTTSRRGRHRIEHVHVWSIFPLGLFRKGMRYRLGLEYLAYPELLNEERDLLEGLGREGEESSRTVGWGHEILSLRGFRPGDDPRSIHWKQSARTGRLIFMERELERGQKISIVLDNGVGELKVAADRDRFERLVSEAATAAVRYLDGGFDVELVTRDRVIPFSRGTAHRYRILEELALIEGRPRAGAGDLAGSDPRAQRLELRMDLAGIVTV